MGNWQISTGILTPAQYIAFQIALTPSATQMGQVVEIIKASTISGKDTFTASNLEARDGPISSDLPDDSTMTWEKGRVSE